MIHSKPTLNLKASISKLLPGQSETRMSEDMSDISSVNPNTESNEDLQNKNIFNPIDTELIISSSTRRHPEHLDELQNERNDIDERVKKPEEIDEMRNTVVENSENVDLVPDTPEYIEVSQYDMFDRRTDLVDNNVKIVIEPADDEDKVNDNDNKVIFDKSNSVGDLTKKYNDIASTSSVNLRQAIGAKCLR